MSTRILKNSVATMLLSVGLAFPSVAPAFATPAEDGARKMGALIEGSSYHHTQLKPNIWTIDFTGKNIPQFKVLVVGDELDVIFVIVVDHGKYAFSPALAKKLLAFDSSMDRVKVGINDTGDIFVRVDVASRTLDAAEFRANVEQVAAASDEVFGGIKPLLGNGSSNQ